MIKVLLFSDIHANLPALESFFEAIEDKNYDFIYCLGDLVGYQVWPNEVINELRKRNISVISGNHDTKVNSLTDTELLNEANYAYSLIGNDEKQYLASLPNQIRLDFEGFTLLLVHGSPFSNKEYLLEDKDENEFLEVFNKSKATILCFGHTHKPFYRQLKNDTQTFHAINTGSIGKPKDGNPDGCYSLLTINPKLNPSDVNFIKVEFCRFKYDIQKACKAIENSILPNELAEMLKKAY